MIVIYKALRSAGGVTLRLLRKESSVKPTKRRSMLDFKCKQTGDLKKCKEPRRHAPGKQSTDATRMSIPRMYDTYLVSCICGIYIRGGYVNVSKLLTIQSFRCRQDDESVRTLIGCAGLCSACLMSMGEENTTMRRSFNSVEHVVEVTAKRRLFLVTSVTPISTLKMVYLDGGPPHGRVSAVCLEKNIINCRQLA